MCISWNGNAVTIKNASRQEAIVAMQDIHLNHDEPIVIVRKR
jgi:hypothetical protein